MTTPADDEVGWQTFMRDPVGYIHPSQLARAFSGEIGPELAVALADCERLHGRISALVSERNALPPFPDDDATLPQDRAIATASPEALTLIITRAGAVFWASAIANAVRGRDVEALESRLGVELCRFALKHRELAGPREQQLEPFDTLLDRIVLDGWRCYAGWCEALPQAAGARARLRIPADIIADAASSSAPEIGAAIVRAAAIGDEHA